ncbi:nitroreductase family protein [Proteinivorax tanatarense]|uniref:Nitroreductase family protein n=1 Tax=Proteinivorax tanatarense TaxID=1260629 RepID=A0AAU7VM78_9FIRM
MINSELYPVIFKRKSIRKFVKEPLEQSVMEELKYQISKLEPLFENIKTDVAILGEGEVGGIFSIKAPHYIAIYSEEKEGHLLNAGYLLQQLDLFLSKEGVGTLWLGMGKPQETLNARNGLKYVITLVFGKANEEIHRNSASEYKRKELNEISSIDGAEKLIEAVRLAPSSTNNQPWYIEGTENKMAIYCKKLSLVKNTFFPLMKKFLPIDMGIALCHLKIAAANFDKEIDFKKENKSSNKNYEYIITAYTKQIDG